MPTKKIKQRKLPKQSRSKEMVACVLAATARILETKGYDELTTNHVAQKAGVSIGSLYQYFPNKESLVIALAQKLMTDDSLVFAEWITQVSQAIPKATHLQRNESVKSTLLQSEIIISSLLQYFLDLHEKEGRIRFEIYNVLFKLGGSAKAIELRKLLTKQIAEVLSLLQPNRPNSEIQTLAFVIFHSCFGVMQGLSMSATHTTIERKDAKMLKVILTKMINAVLNSEN